MGKHGTIHVWRGGTAGAEEGGSTEDKRMSCLGRRSTSLRTWQQRENNGVVAAVMQRLGAAAQHLSLGAGVEDLGGDVGSVLFKGVREHARQLLDLAVKGLLVGPCIARVQDLGRNTGHGLGHLEVEHLKVFVLGVGQLARVDGVEDGARVLERAALARAELAAGPASVDEVGIGLDLGHALRQHRGVPARVQDNEGLAVARRERRAGLHNTVFSAGRLGGVASDEMVLRLFGRQLADRRQNTKGVACEKDDILRQARDTGDLGVGDEVDRVGAARVLRQVCVIVVGCTRQLVIRHILQDGTVANGVEDFWLLLGAQANALCVAAALDVEDTVVRPDVLVVTNQSAVRVSRQGRLAGAGETKEERNVAIGALVGTRVERQLAELDGLQVVHDGKDTLFHLTSVLGTENDHLATLEVDFNRGRGCHARREAVRRELTGVVDDEVGLAKVLELLACGPDEHIVHEQSVVGTGADDANLDAVLGVPASKAVKDVDVVAGVEVVDGALTVDLKGVLVHLDVDGAPPDVILGRVLVNDALVLGAAAGLLPGEVDQGAGAGDDGAFLLDGVLVELSDRGIALEVHAVHVKAGIGEELDVVTVEQRILGLLRGQLVCVEE